MHFRVYEFSGLWTFGDMNFRAYRPTLQTTPVVSYTTYDKPVDEKSEKKIER